MIEGSVFFNYGALLNQTYKIFISFKDEKPKDSSKILNVIFNLQMIKDIYTLARIKGVRNCGFYELLKAPSQVYEDRISFARRRGIFS